MDKKKILAKIENCTARTGVIGLGYVGLSLMLAIARAGFHVTGIDNSKSKIASLKSGLSDLPSVSDRELATFIESKRIEVTNDYSVLNDLDTIHICVPTPLRKDKIPDLQYIITAVEQIAKYLCREQLIVLESTTYPGTTEEIALSRLATQTNMRVGEDFYLAFSPERIEPGNKSYMMSNTPKIVGGITPECTYLAKTFYEQFISKVYPVSSSRVAEMVKLLENTFRYVNIGFINEMALICDKMELDIWEVINAASTKPFGFMPFYPGPGPGGHCIPIDPHYLSWKAKSYQLDTRFIELACEINSKMPSYVLDKIIHALNYSRKALNGSKILVLGVSYKKDVADTRESPALEVIRLIADSGGEVVYHDPYVSQFSLVECDSAQKASEKIYHCQPLTESLLKSVDCVVILTDHNAIDYTSVVRGASLIVDARNATESVFVEQKTTNTTHWGKIIKI
ncbi:MAG: nucleotide sugar dehydrogenase [Candidatus Poribacteria bacterium]|nr:nucleotide sugar dehydrogenase [Candidatus Poribacteria bacterium]